MKQTVLQSKIIDTDDTSVPILDGSRTQTRKGYLWAYIGDKRTVVFDYTPTHNRDGPVAFLGDYGGYVRADAYQGYDAFFENGDATEVGCWAHTRRKFYDARTTDPRRAHEMLALIGKLYDIEREAKLNELNASAVKELRQQHSKPILAEINPRLEGWSIEVLPKSPIGQAVSYARGQWEALNQYLDDGDSLIMSLDAGETHKGHGTFGEWILVSITGKRPDGLESIRARLDDRPASHGPARYVEEFVRHVGEGSYFIVVSPSL